jgi:nucleoside-diphosphate-sugar epimerase
MIIAITGAAGLVGRAVTQYALSQNHTVLALDLAPDIDIQHENYTYKCVDAMDFKAFKGAVEEGKCEGLIHLAAKFNHYKGGVMRPDLGEQVSVGPGNM